MKEDYSFGIIPIKKEGVSWQMLLVCHRAGHWGFPKGHGHEGELPRESAERELFEETGYRVKNYLFSETFEEHYVFKWLGEEISKTVTYYMAEVEGELIHQEEELTEARWVFLSEAPEYFTFPEARALLTKVNSILNNTMS